MYSLSTVGVLLLGVFFSGWGGGVKVLSAGVGAKSKFCSHTLYGDLGILRDGGAHEHVDLLWTLEETLSGLGPPE